jgi:hypothetical protein
MNYIKKMQHTVTIYEQAIKELRSYLALPKFYSPNDYVHTADLHLRLRELVDDKLSALEAGEYPEHKPQAFAALDKHDRSIVTILAMDPVEADAMVQRELTLNPSREPYYRWWDAAGRRMRTDSGEVWTKADYQDYLAETQGA